MRYLLLDVLKEAIVEVFNLSLFGVRVLNLGALLLGLAAQELRLVLRGVGLGLCAEHGC